MARQVYVTHEGGILLVRTEVEGSRLYVAADAEESRAWWQTIRSHWIPEAVGYAISAEGINILLAEAEQECKVSDDKNIADPDAPYRLGPLGMRFIACGRSFLEFLKVWYFLDQDAGVVRLFGLNIWPGQVHVAEVMERESRAAWGMTFTETEEMRTPGWIYFLKARQIGFTTLCIAYDAWIMRFRPNARVHLVSRTETLAKTSLLKPLKFGLQRLPEEMVLPETQTTTTMYELDAGEHDRRIAQAYAAKEPGRGETCSHLHLDEWAAMMETSPELPAEVWAAAEPTISKEGGTCHILTTGVGPVGYYAETWKSCIAGLGQHFACFIGAEGSRPHYTKKWLADKKRSMADDARFAHEYPQKWEDALAGRGDTTFKSRDIDLAAEYARGFMSPIYVRDPATNKVLRVEDWGYYTLRGKKRARAFVTAWDIGGPGANSDASVGIVLDVTEGVWQVRWFEYHQGLSYPLLAQHIRRVHYAYPGKTYIEDNGPGQAVRQFTNIPEDQIEGWKTTAQSKPGIIQGVNAALQFQEIKWDPKQCPELDAEMRGYRQKDEHIKQDCVMALAIAMGVGSEAHTSAQAGTGVIRLGIPGAV